MASSRCERHGPAVFTARVPGKLFIAGEYAVITPGEPSVLVAVDRYLTVRLTESTSQGFIHSPAYASEPMRWTHHFDEATRQIVMTVDKEPDDHRYDYVLAVLRITERLRAERESAPGHFDLLIDSGLVDETGTKFGLGSSAAVTVATIRVTDKFNAFGLSDLEVFKLALLATLEVAPEASGGDLAACTFEGWVGYRSPDRELLARRLASGGVDELLRDEDAWADLEIVRLPPPRRLRLLVGWTGSPASTVRLVDEVTTRAHSGDLDFPAFLVDSRACVSGLWDALSAGDDAATLTAIRQARRLLQRLGRQAGVTIETERLAALCDAAEAAGAVGKSSGAGGGDCGIVLAPADADTASMLRDWEAHGIRPLSVTVPSGEGAAHVG